MTFKITVTLTETNTKDGKLVIEADTRNKAKIINKSLKAAGNTVRNEMTKEVIFE